MNGESLYTLNMFTYTLTRPCVINESAEPGAEGNLSTLKLNLDIRTTVYAAWSRTASGLALISEESPFFAHTFSR